jgi:hypothetical protein
MQGPDDTSAGRLELKVKVDDDTSETQIRTAKMERREVANRLRGS